MTIVAINYAMHKKKIAKRSTDDDASPSRTARADAVCVLENFQGPRERHTADLVSQSDDAHATVARLYDVNTRNHGYVPFDGHNFTSYRSQKHHFTDNR